jgi:glycosidase
MSDLLAHLEFLYGRETALEVLPRLRERLKRYQPPSLPVRPLNHQDVVLIAYPDHFQEPNTPPLQSLRHFCTAYLKDIVTGLHILPFFPYSSDDGFSVIDFYQVDPRLGTWEDIQALARDFVLIVDLVLNHTSTQCPWFQSYLRGDDAFRDFYIRADPTSDLSMVVRPRALPLLTPFESPIGHIWVWTTFSADQVDLNYKNPAVLLQMIDVLLTYLEKGARIIRLDAIAYLWKEPGTPCIHLPQTHCIVRLFRSILDIVAPHAMLITETNVPHHENLSYFGNGTDEAHMVYNFTLPPLVMHTLLSGNAEKLSDWASTNLKLPAETVTFFNFLASHDGIGVNPARGILADAEIDNLVNAAIQRGGLVSYKHNSDGSQSPYELNITYFDAISDPHNETVSLHRFLTAHAILLALRGLPAIYASSLIGARNWHEGVHVLGYNRAINRQKFLLKHLYVALTSSNTLQAKVLAGLRRLLQARKQSPAFDPYSEQKILDSPPEIFGVLRLSKDGSHRVLCLQNVTPNPQPLSWLDFKNPPKGPTIDLINNKRLPENTDISLMTLPPYGILWLEYNTSEAPFGL